MRYFVRSMGMLVMIAAAAVVVQRLIDAPNRDALAVMVVMPAMAFVAFRRRRHVKQYVEFRTQGGAATFERWATMSHAERRERVLAGRPGGPSGRRRARAAAGAPPPGAHLPDDEVAAAAEQMVDRVQ